MTLIQVHGKPVSPYAAVQLDEDNQVECYAHVVHASVHFSRKLNFHQHHRLRCSAAYRHTVQTQFRSLYPTLQRVQNVC